MSSPGGGGRNCFWHPLREFSGIEVWNFRLLSSLDLSNKRWRRRRAKVARLGRSYLLVVWYTAALIVFVACWVCLALPSLVEFFRGPLLTSTSHSCAFRVGDRKRARMGLCMVWKTKQMEACLLLVRAICSPSARHLTLYVAESESVL